MCGITAYLGNKQAAPILIDMLKKLEYRGYDSCGLATIDKDLICKKDSGNISEVNKKLNLTKTPGSIGIAHTRWATHGQPNSTNAHPHLSQNKEIAIVHNGIIENAEELKKLLESKNYSFRTQTDSEVIAYLIEDLMNQNNSMQEAFIKSLKLIKGAYAIVAINKNNPNKLYLAKQSSPLIIGLGKNEIFAASDISAIQKYTRSIIYLQDNDIAILEKNNYTIQNLKDLHINREVTTLTQDIEEISKGDFEHFMLKEIFEQPKTIERAFEGRILEDIPKFGGLNISEENLKNINQIILLGCGTSWHACLVGAYLLEEIANIPAKAEYASEFRYKKPVLNKNDLIIALSQSGETADTIAALNAVESQNLKTIGIVNVVGSTISRMVDGGIYLHAGQEIGVASTKTFTSHLVILYLLSIYLARLRNTITKEKAKQMLDELKNLPDLIKQQLNQSKEIEKIAEKYFTKNNALYLGRHYNFPVALEGALKLKEISYIHAEGYPAAEMKHGPIALIDENMPVIVIAPEDRLYKKILSNIEEVKTRKGKIIAISTQENKLFDETIKIPKVSEPLMPIISVIPIQLLAYHIAKKRGCSIDKPRNLAKSVTVE